MEPELVSFIGIFLGVLFRTLAPALRKWIKQEEDKPFEWSHKYTVTALLTILIAFLATIIGFASFKPPEEPTMTVLAQSLVHGLTLNTVLNEVEKWFELKGG